MFLWRFFQFIQITHSLLSVFSSLTSFGSSWRDSFFSPLKLHSDQWYYSSEQNSPAKRKVTKPRWILAIPSRKKIKVPITSIPKHAKTIAISRVASDCRKSMIGLPELSLNGLMDTSLPRVLFMMTWILHKKIKIILMFLIYCHWITYL